MTRFAISATLTIALLAAPTAAHVPAHCTADKIEALAIEKFQAVNDLTASTEQQDLPRMLKDTSRFIQVDGRLMAELHEWIACIDGTSGGTP